MATTKSSSTSKPSGAAMFQKASLSEFGGGRWEGGIATCTKSVYGPFKYPGSDTGKHTLFTLTNWRSEDGEDHPVQYQAGFFGETDPDKLSRNAYPSKDGIVPAGPEGMDLEELLEIYAKLASGDMALTPEEEEDYQGPSVVFKVDPDHPSSPKLPKKDWAQFIDTVIHLPEFQAEDGTSTFPLTDDANCVVGYKFDLSWLPQANRSKSQREKAGGKTFEVLVPTQSFGIDEEWQTEIESEKKGTTTAATKATTTAKKVAKPEPEEVEDETEETDETEFNLEKEVENLVYLQLVEIGREATKVEFNSKVVQALSPENRRPALGFLSDNKWLTSTDRPWTSKGGKFSA